MLHIIFILVILGIFFGIVAVLGNTASKPWHWGAIATTFATIYLWLLTTWANFVEHIWIPAWESITAQRVPGTYEIGAVILVIGLGFYIVMMFRTAIVSWTREGVIKLAA